METIRIVIADACKLMADCLERALETQGKRFTILGKVGSGRALVTLAEELEPDMIIMDTVLPDINGVDAAMRIHAQNDDLSILAVATRMDQESIMAMLQSGVSGYILKSCGFDDLITAIECIAQGQIYLCPCIASVVVETALSATKDTKQTCFSVLSSREREVLQLISEGHTSRRIAEKLFIAPKTVQIHKTNLKKKLNLKSTAALTRFAVSKGITSLDFIDALPPEGHNPFID